MALDYEEERKRQEWDRVTREREWLNSIIRKTVVASVSVLVLGAGTCWGVPQYRVYSANQTGKAELAQATSNRTIKTLEAKAAAEAAKSLAEADVERAKGVAQANQIIGRSLQQNPEYMKWLYIEALKESKGSTIYVPTEGSYPLVLK